MSSHGKFGKATSLALLFGRGPLANFGFQFVQALISVSMMIALLVWKIYGRRFDGYENDDYPTITQVGELTSLRWKGEKVPDLDYSDEKALSDYVRRYVIDNDFTGSMMPPAEAVASGKVQPLTDEDRRTIVRWIDLGCPIDVDPQYNPAAPNARSYG